MADHNLDYSNLGTCQVKIQSSAATDKPPVLLPQECWNAANIVVPQMYDFSVGTFLLYVFN